MEAEKAIFAVGLLVGTTGVESSWSQQTMDYYVNQLSQLGDGDLLIEACRQVANTWNEPGRARVGAVMDAYKSLVMRKELHSAPQQIEEGRDIPPWRDGIEIARSAYHEECRRQHREPDDRRFESILARGIGSTA